MSTNVPKPGPHLSQSSTHYPPYRDLAKQHVTAANSILAEPVDGEAEPELLDYLAAIAHALTAIAFTEMAPPARYRPRADHPRSGVKR